MIAIAFVVRCPTWAEDCPTQIAMQDKNCYTACKYGFVPYEYIFKIDEQSKNESIFCRLSYLLNKPKRPMAVHQYIEHYMVYAQINVRTAEAQCNYDCQINTKVISRLC